MEEKLQVYGIYLAPSELDCLGRMAREGGFATTSRLIRSLLREIIRDDRADHEEKAKAPLPGSWCAWRRLGL